ncbi:MAG: hypothetical protein QW815_00365 [Nitrososphaerota archaeon]
MESVHDLSLFEGTTVTLTEVIPKVSYGVSLGDVMSVGLTEGLVTKYRPFLVNRVTTVLVSKISREVTVPVTGVVSVGMVSAAGVSYPVTIQEIHSLQITEEISPTETTEVTVTADLVEDVSVTHKVEVDEVVDATLTESVGFAHRGGSFLISYDWR